MNVHRWFLPGFVPVFNQSNMVCKGICGESGGCVKPANDQTPIEITVVGGVTPINHHMNDKCDPVDSPECSPDRHGLIPVTTECCTNVCMVNIITHRKTPDAERASRAGKLGVGITLSAKAFQMRL
ncbi:hypothetical protein HTX81_09290 [Pseudomonas lini]|uniref:hypothetical protein n=1 Tax=Pseudomonas lini TaxID=163011 RepID=UPI001574416E|nr:hypothetical protein [Pseudomonas lini]NSX08769.1 hypothetical protein [Pseudomonas lini]